MFATFVFLFRLFICLKDNKEKIENKFTKMRYLARTICTFLLVTGFLAVNAQDIIMGSAPLDATIQEEVRYFFDSGGAENPDDADNPDGNFEKNLDQTMTLKHSMGGNYVLYALFDDFVMGYGDTLWIYDGENVNAPLIGFFNIVNSPGEIYATGSSLTFRFKSDNIDDPGLSKGWIARVNAYKTNATAFKFMNDNGVNFTCNAKFYDSGGATGKIASNNENSNGMSYVTFYSPAETYIKCEFTQFQVNGVMKIYDGPYVPGFPNLTGRLIGQFCTSTLDNSTQNMPPVLFSSTHQLSFVYIGKSGDTGKDGWEATISCVPALFESPEGSACPKITNVPSGAYADLSDDESTIHVIDFDCSKPVVVLEAGVIATGKFTNDYTVQSIPFSSSIFQFNQGNPIGASTDDAWLSAVNLPFKFSFFGKTYTKVYPGTNGLVSMNAQSGYCYYSYPQPQTEPPYSAVPYNPNSASSNPYRNAIYGVFEDIDCGYYIDKNDGLGMGNVRVGVLGQYPCRAFVFNYLNVGLFGNHGSSDKYNTYQMVIYEGTNIIDVFVKHRNCCASTNNSNHEGVIGLHNNTSSQILLAPGRGMTGWTVNENQGESEGWRFTPITPLDEFGSLAWYENVVDEAHLISFDSTAKNRRIAVSPTETTKIISEYKYTNAAGDNFTLRDTTLIRVQIPSISTSRSSGSNFICPNENCQISVNVNQTDFPNIHPEHYSWSSGESDTTQTVTVAPDSTKTYFVTVTYDNGCTKVDSIKVDVTDLELPEILATDTVLCVGESTTLVAQHPTTNDFKWSTGETTASITVTPQVTTLYKVEAKMIGDCIVTDTITIYVNDLPKPAFMASPTEIFVENGVGTVTCNDLSQETYSLLWNFGDFESNTNIVQDVSNPTHDYIRAGYYTITLTATDDNGCIDSVKNRVSVTVPYFFYIPSAFTPNSDGTNERFAPQGSGVDPDNYSMQIFDRNGMIVFSTKNPFDYWDGRNKKGQMCPDGVYVYIIRLINLNGDDKEYTGTVTLMK